MFSLLTPQLVLLLQTTFLSQAPASSIRNPSRPISLQCPHASTPTSLIIFLYFFFANFFFLSGVATTDGSTIFLLFGEDPQQTDTPHWFVCMIDVMQHTLVRGSSRSAALLPVAFHFNPRANGTMILSAMMHEIEGADPIQVSTQQCEVCVRSFL